MAGMGKVSVKIDHISRLIPEYSTKFILLSVTDNDQGSTYNDVVVYN